jgi:hypothetical protein
LCLWSKLFAKLCLSDQCKVVLKAQWNGERIGCRKPYRNRTGCFTAPAGPEQRAISRRIVTLLGQTQTLTRREQAAPQDAPQAYREATLLPVLP